MTDPDTFVACEIKLGAAPRVVAAPRPITSAMIDTWERVPYGARRQRAEPLQFESVRPHARRGKASGAQFDSVIAESVDTEFAGLSGATTEESAET